jgi:hypothetical protein
LRGGSHCHVQWTGLNNQRLAQTILTNTIRDILLLA